MEYSSKCPICGNKLIIKNWYEDYYRVETDEKCLKCKYHKNWAYGRTDIEFQGYSESFGYSIDINTYYKIYKKFNKARWSYRKYLLRTNKIKGKTYSKWL